MIALLVALAVAVLISVQPWGNSTLAPQVSLAPEIGVALNDAVEAAPGRQLAVAPAQTAGGGAARLATNEPAVSKEASGSRANLAPAAVVRGNRAGAPSSSPKPPAPDPAPSQPVLPPEGVPVVAPVSVPAPEAAPPTRVLTGGSSQSPGPIAGGVDPEEEGPTGPVEIQAGDELEYRFFFYLEPTAFRAPGSDNLIVQIRGEASEDPNFALQLWDDGTGQRGLWASGDAMGGERFLAPDVEGAWHEVVIYLQASSEDDGFYLLTLDGEVLDARAWVSLIESGSSFAQLEVGLFREGERVLNPTDIFLEPAQLVDAS